MSLDISTFLQPADEAGKRRLLRAARRSLEPKDLLVVRLGGPMRITDVRELGRQAEEVRVRISLVLGDRFAREVETIVPVSAVRAVDEEGSEE